MIILLTAGWLWLSRRTPETAAHSETPVIAVLPFKNLSDGKESDYFTDGLTDELIRNLSIIEGLEVRSRTSSFTFKDKPYNLREVGEKLNVNFVLDGTVQRSGGNLRINAQFVRVSIVLISASRYDEAEAYLEQSRDNAESSDNSSISWARVRLGQARVAEAIQLLENQPERSINSVIRGWLGIAYARSGRREEAEKMAAISQYADEQALIFAGLGDKDRTIEALERMGSRGPQRVVRFLMYPEFAFLRGDPRLAALRKKVGLPQENSGK